MSLASRVQPHVPTVTGKRHQATVALKALIDPPGNFTSLLAGSALLISNSGTWSITCTGQILPYGLVRNTIFNKSKTCSSASFTLPSPFSAVHNRGTTVNRCAALFSNKSKCQQGVSKQRFGTCSANSHSDCQCRKIDARFPFRSIRLEGCLQQQGPLILVTKARQTMHLCTYVSDIKSSCFSSRHEDDRLVRIRSL